MHQRSSRAALSGAAALFLGLLAFAAPAAAATQAARIEQAVVAVEDRGAHGLEVALAPDLLGRLAAENRAVLTDVPLPGGRAVDLRLERFDWPPASGLLGMNGKLALGKALAAGMTFWSGSVPGDAGSDVFLAFSPSGTRGWVRSGGELVHVLARPGDSGGWKSPGLVLLRDQDLRDSGATPPIGCATPPPPSPRPALGKAPRTSPSFATGDRGFLPLIQARVALETDWQFYSLFNDLDAARTYAMTLLGAASLRYEEQAGIVLLPVYVGLHDNPSDPWATPETPGATTTMLLDEFRQAWDQGAAPAVADLHHFLCSGFAGGGEAYLGTVCNGDWSFGVSTGINSLTPIPIVPKGASNWDFYVLAHEIGHNFDAIHTHEYCPVPLDECAPPGSFGPCQTQQVCTSSGTLMSFCHLCPGALGNITTTFHAQSAADMRAFAEGSCLPRLHGQTTRVSVDSAGAQGNGDCFSLSLSADGRFVAFDSVANNLVPGDTNGSLDVFIHDRLAGTTSRASVDAAGGQGNGHSQRPSLSADGRFVAFDSWATNLVPGDTNGKGDVFVHDRLTGVTSRASVNYGGFQGNNDSHSPFLSADGRFVAFVSWANNLVPGDTNGWLDVFVRDRLTGTTSRASVDSAGSQGNNHSSYPSLSADGRLVAFYSDANNLVPGDTNGWGDAFVHDRLTGTTSRASVDSAGAQGDYYTFYPSLSADGRFVAFCSYATNLVPGDTNGTWDVFVHDRLTGTTSRASVDSAGAQGNGSSYHLSPSADGRFVVFQSYATNLVPGDTNGNPDAFVHENLLHPASGAWTLLGGGTLGSLGKPVLAATGTLQLGSSVSFDLENAPASTLTLLIASNDWQAYPVGQGMLWPVLTLAIPVNTNASGQITLTFPWPALIPAQTPLYIQWAVADPTAVMGTGFTLSNAAWGISN